MAKQEAAGSGREVPAPSVALSTPGPLVADSAEWLRVTLIAGSVSAVALVPYDGSDRGTRFAQPWAGAARA